MIDAVFFFIHQCIPLELSFFDTRVVFGDHATKPHEMILMRSECMYLVKASKIYANVLEFEWMVF